MDNLETLWGGFTLESAPDVFPLSTESILLADFARLRPQAKICDLGSGSGVLGLLLCARRDDCTVTGVERQPAALELCKRNIDRNGLSDRMTVLEGDLGDYRQLLPYRGFTDVVSNPPCYPPELPNSIPPQWTAARTKSKLYCSMWEVALAAAWSLTWGGHFFVVHCADFLSSLSRNIHSAGMELKRLRLVRQRPGAEPSLVLVDAVRGGRPGIRWEPDLFLETEDGAPSPELLQIYGRKGDL